MSHVEICNAFNCGFDVQPFKANTSFCIFCSFHFVSFLFILLEVTCFSFLSPVVTRAVSFLSHETDVITEEGPGGRGRQEVSKRGEGRPCDREAHRGTADGGTQIGHTGTGSQW